jgi:hypothetical protein
MELGFTSLKQEQEQEQRGLITLAEECNETDQKPDAYRAKHQEFHVRPQ